MKECPSCHRCFQDQVNHCPGDGERLKFLVPLDLLLDERYQLERKLGQGGMGLVFKAYHKFIRTQHAVKVILPDLVGNDPSLVARFRQEAMAAAAIRHPNTVNVTDYGILNDTTPYLVMEFVEGVSLHELLVREKRLQPVEAVEIILAVCAGVAAAHRQGIVHRDLKPLNIMLRPGEPPGESVKVLDFGLAKIKSGELLGSLVAAQTQGMLGSPFYMAPEQWHDDEIDARADIYSMGVILYQMLAGDVPFKGKSIPSIMNMHLNSPPVPLSERGIEVPEPLERAVQHALEKEPARRPQTVREFMNELRASLPSLSDIHLTREPGMETANLGPADTMGLSEVAGLQTGEIAGAPDSPLKTVISSPDALAASKGETNSAATVAEPSASNNTGGGQARASDTARQKPARTVGQSAAGDGAPRAPGDAMTEPLPESFKTRRAEEERLRAEALRSRQEEERRAREAELKRKREAEESQRRAAEERARLEADERARREAEERSRREAEERAALAAQYEAQRQAALAQQQQQQASGYQYETGGAQASGVVEPRPSRALPILLGAVAALVLLAGVGVLAYFVLPGVIKSIGNTNASNANTGANVNARGNTNAAANVNTSANSNGGAGKNRTAPDLVELPGGTYRMGRDDVPPLTDELKTQRPQYALWMYNQWPAHAVAVGAFAIDRTEVTNAEYAEFVKETRHQPPPGIWDGARPKAGEEQLPVTNVTYEDARAFAEWRSRRDGVRYALPTEEQWEYAARGGGDPARLYPWGSLWETGRANIGTNALSAVCSMPQGNTPQGVCDMIGNVWEWTASEAAMYKGNSQTELDKRDRGKVVVRGGSYGSKTDGDEPVTVAARRWIARDTRDPRVGFRLVRVGP